MTGTSYPTFVVNIITEVGTSSLRHIKSILVRSCIRYRRGRTPFKCGLGDRGYCGGQGVGGPRTHPV